MSYLSEGFTRSESWSVAAMIRMPTAEIVPRLPGADGKKVRKDSGWQFSPLRRECSLNVWELKVASLQRRQQFAHTPLENDRAWSHQNLARRG
jgi:hypothetical protein